MDVIAQIGLAHTFGAMTDNHGNAAGVKRPGGFQSVQQQGFSPQGMEHLGQVGLHPSTLAGGENNYTEFLHKVILSAKLEL
jgi:hypothetical protein